MTKLRLKIQINWKIALGVFFIVMVLLRLGFWQLDRAEQKRQIQQDRDAQRLAAPVSIELLNLDDQKALKGTKIKLQGHFDNTKSILVSKQIFQGRSGYEVITLFNLQAGDRLILVSRGWVSAKHRQQLPVFTAVTGVQSLVGEIYVPADKSFFLPQKIDATASWPLRVHHFDINDISQFFDRPVLPFIVRLEKDSPGVLMRHWWETRLQTTNSTSYALQWFAMVLLLSVIIILKSTNILEIIRSNKTKD